MTSICNYSHPEQQITTGLLRQTSGKLFPYNPEFYELASGLYGPGTIYCWYLLLASVFINWFFQAKKDKGCQRPGISNDLLAALAYPAFAATDAVIHAMKFLGTEYRALAIFCLRYPEVKLTGLATFNQTQLDLRDIPPEILSLGQRAIDITGPLPVCYTFTGVMFVGLLLNLLLAAEGQWRPTKWAIWLTCGTYGYVLLLMTMFHLSLGDIGLSMALSFYEVIMPFLIFVTFAECILLSIATLGGIAMLAQSLLERDNKKTVDALKCLGCCLVLAAFPGIALLDSFNGFPFVPDLAISVGERDQAAALLGGIVTILFTVGHLFLRYRNEKKVLTESEEEGMLTG